MADIEKQMMRIIKSGNNAKGKTPVVNNLSGDVNSDKPFEEYMNKPVDSAECDSDKKDKPKRHGIENLKPQNTRTKEEQRQIAIQGGKASGEARRKKKAIKEICETLLSMQANEALKARIDSDIELPEGATLYDVLVASMAQEAIIEGNVKAAEFIRDSAGDKPTDRSEVKAAVMTAQDLELLKNIERRMLARDGQKEE